MVLLGEITRDSNTVINAAAGIHHGDLSYLYNGVFGTSVDVEARSSEMQLSSLHFSLSILREKVNEVESFMNSFRESNQYNVQPVDQLTYSMAFSSMAILMQQIVDTASSMMLNCQQMGLGLTETTGNNNDVPQTDQMPADVRLEEFDSVGVDGGNNQGFWDRDNLYNWYVHSTTYSSSNQDSNNSTSTPETAMEEERNRDQEWEVVEIDAADLLARLIHYCQVCNRGFKRETNLKMHMRAHGDKYKECLNSISTTSNDEKKSMRLPRKYSCPQKGCRWNKNHAKFQPLKSIVCVRNHYKRSHCPKMFICKRCNLKQFAVLSDLKTHENHCGDIKWYCSCGTTFSKKDKLMDHVGLFVGHTPLFN